MSRKIRYFHVFFLLQRPHYASIQRSCYDYTTFSSHHLYSAHKFLWTGPPFFNQNPVFFSFCIDFNNFIVFLFHWNKNILVEVVVIYIVVETEVLGRYPDPVKMLDRPIQPESQHIAGQCRSNNDVLMKDSGNDTMKCVIHGWARWKKET